MKTNWKSPEHFREPPTTPCLRQSNRSNRRILTHPTLLYPDKTTTSTYWAIRIFIPSTCIITFRIGFGEWKRKSFIRHKSSAETILSFLEWTRPCRPNTSGCTREFSEGSSGITSMLISGITRIIKDSNSDQCQIRSRPNILSEMLTQNIFLLLNT